MRKLPRVVLSIALAATVVQAPAAHAAANPAVATAANNAGTGENYVTDRDGPGRFPLVAKGVAAPLVVSTSDYAG